MLLPDLIAQSAERFPEKAALIFTDESISFRALHEQSNQVTARLWKLGIGPGVRVAILHENALASVIFFWGILQSGAQVVDIPCLAGVGTIAGILAEANPAAIVISERQLQRFSIANVDCLPAVVLTGRTRSTPVPGRAYHSLTEITRTETAEVAPQ